MNLYKHVSDAINEKLGFAANMEVPRNREFGDFSTNAAMVMAKSAGRPPRELAGEILPKIAELDFVADASIAGPGFINIKIKDDFIWSAANNHYPAGVAGTPSPAKGNLTIDLDYGSYNVAKALHIGHLRGGIVGDTFYRIAKFLGHKPISYNHMGDWGKPMALVIAWIIKKFPNDWNRPDFKIDESEFNGYYPAASAHAKENPEFQEQVLIIKKEFQDGRADYFALYEKMLKISLAMMSDVVRRLNMLPFDNNLGERNAALYLEPVEKILREKNLIEKSDGAEIIVLKRDDDNAPMPPYMWRDSRGADTYDSTDLAAIYYRKITDNPDRMLYFSDYRQKLHFEQLFRASELSGIFPADRLEFPYFGGINGADGKPYKTRSGSVAGLMDMIQTVSDAARARVAESGKNLPDDTVDMIALAALKFNDLIHDVKADYIFDPASVTSFEGRTGPYILYTAVRLNSVLKKLEERIAAPRQCAERRAQSEGATDEEGTPATCDLRSTLCIDERNLLIGILEFQRAVQGAFDNRAPDILANYTYDLCQLANTFYHNCPILRDDIPADIRAQRLHITKIAFDTLATAIDLMGMKIPPEM
ncbi:MAG: arginine--tRNA ligase [Rickettsiales bacterium]|jgi:arginyl-tRNA synthetase|nr:arginine--tRNA ligase [Rickettsiales bacterium]